MAAGGELVTMHPPHYPSTFLNVTTSSPTRRIPLWLKLAYSAYLAVLIPVYWKYYGPTNFLFLCDVSLLLTLAGLWRESALLISMPTVGILLPQLFWSVDFLLQLCVGKSTGLTGYMFEADHSLLLRGLSVFHGWLPFLLIYLVAMLGYDRRALPAWSLLCTVICLAAFFLLPAAGAVLADPLTPRNVNYVHGWDDTKPQTWLPPLAYLILWITAMIGLVVIPTHFLLKKFAPSVRNPLPSH